MVRGAIGLASTIQRSAAQQGFMQDLALPNVTQTYLSLSLLNSRAHAA